MIAFPIRKRAIWFPLLLLLAGCGTPPTGTMVLDAVAAPTPTTVRLTDITGTEPRSGRWTFSWELGSAPVVREVGLTFMSDGTITTDDVPEEMAEPTHWSDRGVTFQGNCGFSLPDQRSGVSCARYSMTLESTTRMVGTVSLMVNHRWLDVPATGAFAEDVR